MVGHEKETEREGESKRVSDFSSKPFSRVLRCVSFERVRNIFAPKLSRTKK